jgi:hypothetical protein
MCHQRSAAIVALIIAIVVVCVPAESSERTIVGYASPITVRPGETVEFKVNSVNGPEGYQADLVKIINGDSLSRYGDLFEMRAVEAPFSLALTGPVGLVGT